MHNQKLLLILLLTVAVAVSSDVVDVEAEDVDAASTGISTLAPGAQHSRNLVKRAPTSSFIGMRGKKEQEATTDDHWSGPDPVEYAEDDADDYYNENGRRLKKAPMSFVGMRGKKYSHGNSNLRSLLEEMEEERVRDNVLREIFNQIVGDDNEVGKRAPTGFTGMRGKRPASEDEEDALELMQKRALANSFVGVRGKKDVSHQNYKRAALSELWRKLFKKAYDVRGKKQRYTDFNNKFVAVRGKKNGLDQEDSDLEQNSVQPWVYLVGGKRAPNGFVGMRGKRPALME